MSTTKRSWIIALVGIGLSLIAAGLSPMLLARAQDATPEVTPDAPQGLYQVEAPPEVTGDNSYCMICHSQPWQTVTLGDGTIQNLYVDPDTIANSVHGEDSPSGTLGCIDCHGADAFPHNNPTPADGRAYALYAVELCVSCHADEVEELINGLHEEAILAGNTSAAVCTDCHGAHAVQPVVEQPELIAGVCGDCHENTLTEWRVSAHNDIGPLGCATCHSPHSQRLRAGNTSDELCLNCHEDVGERFVHTQHNSSEAPVACVDCHMFRESQHIQDSLAQPVSLFEQSTGHTMVMDTAPCTTCHEELVRSGDWERLVAEREVVAPPEVPAEIPLDEMQAAVSESAETSYIPLIQGLVLGLGFGVTFAAIFLTRGNRSPQPVEAAHAPTEAPHTPIPPVSNEPPQADSPNKEQS